MHRALDSGPFRVRIEAGKSWVAPAGFLAKELERRESIYVLGTAIPNRKAIGGSAVACDKKELRPRDSWVICDSTLGLIEEAMEFAAGRI